MCRIGIAIARGLRRQLFAHMERERSRAGALPTGLFPAIGIGTSDAAYDSWPG